MKTLTYNDSITKILRLNNNYFIQSWDYITTKELHGFKLTKSTIKHPSFKNPLSQILDPTQEFISKLS